MILYMWGAIFFTLVLALHAAVACISWQTTRNHWNSDSVEERDAAQYALKSIVIIPTGLVWPLTIVVAAVYGVYRLIKSLNHSANKE